MAEKEMRAIYAETLVELAKKDNRIMVVEADLMKATGTSVFFKEFPERTVDVGIAESNMIGVAAGLSEEGKIPFAATFGCFASRRDFDQFFISANYAKLNVKLVGTDPGVTAAFNGGTHMPFEDTALMRTIPGLTIFEPSDPVSVAAFTRLSAEHTGCTYMRLPRKASPKIYDDNEKFKFGESKILREGKDVTIAALGGVLVGEALKAADELAKDGINAEVIDILTVKPLDEKTIFGSAQKTGRLLVAENHQLAGGVCSAVAEILAEKGLGIKFARIGVQDEFGEVGTQEYLMKRFGMTAENIIEKVKGLM